MLSKNAVPGLGKGGAAEVGTNMAPVIDGGPLAMADTPTCCLTAAGKETTGTRAPLVGTW